MKCKSLLTLILVCYAAASDGQIVSNPTDPRELCSLFKEGMRIRKPGTCNEYITCTGGTGTYSTCDNSKLFDSNKQTCVLEDALSTKDNYCRNRCEGLNGKWVADPCTCRGYLFCNSGTAIQGYCENNYFFSEKSQMCEFEDKSDCQVVPNVCELVPDKTQYRNEKDCTSYYECSNGKSTKKTCRSTYFNVETGSCMEKSSVSCTSPPLPSRVCGTDSKPYKGFKDDGATCRGFFYCRNLGTVRDLEPSWSQCPVGKFFSFEDQGCVDPVDAVCKYNRCQGRPDMMVQAGANNCRDYIICKNGVQKAQHSCSGDRFFDELSQACVVRKIYYASCDKQK